MYESTNYFLENPLNLSLITAADVFLFYRMYSILCPSVPKDATPASAEVEEKINARAREMEINKHVKVFNIKERNEAYIEGINVPGFNSLQLLISKDLQNNNFVISHELAHAKHNDPLMCAIIYTMAPMIATAFIPYGYPLLCFNAALVAIGLAYMRHEEKLADLTAAQYCKNIEVSAFVQKLDRLRERSLYYRNAASRHSFFASCITKTMYTSTGDYRFDTHPSDSTRIDYLTPLIEQRQDEDPNIEVYYQTKENEELTKITLATEQSNLLRQIIKNSPNKDTFNTLISIVLLAGDVKGNVQLYKFGDYFPVPYNFEPADINDLQKLPAIINTIMSCPKMLGFKIESNAITEKSKSTFKERLKMLPKQELNIVKLSQVTTSTDEPSVSYICPAYEPLKIQGNKLLFTAAVDDTSDCGIRLG